MRKFFVLILTVLMLASVLAAFPVSAMRVNNSTTADSPSKFVITEFGAEMNAEGAGGTGVLHFMEVLNTSGGVIDMSEVAIARATDYTRCPKLADGDVHFVEPSDTNSQTWLQAKFLAKVKIYPTEIVDEQPYVYAGKLEAGIINDPNNGLKLTNADCEMMLPDDGAAIIWFIGQETMAWLSGQKAAIGLAYDPVDLFLEQFYPGEDNAVLRATLKPYVYMVWAYDNEALDSTLTDKKVATDTFKVEVPNIAAKAEKRSYVYALVDAEWDLADRAYSWANGWNEGLYTYIRHGAQLNENYTGKANCAANSASYIPAQYDPFLYKAKELFIGTEASEIAAYTDYYAAGLAECYLECALVDMGKGATPGMLTDWQWSFIDATKLPAGKTAEAARTEFVDLFGYNDDDTLPDGGRDEPTIEINPPQKDKEGLECFEHRYDDVFDTSCNECNDVRTLPAHLNGELCVEPCYICAMVRSLDEHVGTPCTTPCVQCDIIKQVVQHVYTKGTCESNCEKCKLIDIYTAHVENATCGSECEICACIHAIVQHMHDHACQSNCHICNLIVDVTGHAFEGAAQQACVVCKLVCAYATHKYDHEYDADCNTCGAVRQLGLSPSLVSFNELMGDLLANEQSKSDYGKLYALVTIYNGLSQEEKSFVAESYAALQPIIAAYNASAELANKELGAAVEFACAPLAEVYNFLSGMWFVFKERFWM